MKNLKLHERAPPKVSVVMKLHIRIFFKASIMVKWAVTTCAWTKSDIHCQMQLISGLANRLTWSRALLLAKSARVHCARPADLHTRTSVILLLKIPNAYMSWLGGQLSTLQKKISPNLAKNAGDWLKLLHLHIKSFRGGLKRAVDWCQTEGEPRLPRVSSQVPENRLPDNLHHHMDETWKNFCVGI